MRKKVWKGLAICLLVLAVAALLCACGSKKKNVSGTYLATYNMKEAMNSELADVGMTMESDLNAEFVLQLNEDDSFSFDIDGTKFSETFSEVLTQDGPGMIGAMLEAEGMTEDMYPTIASASGYDSYDAFVDDMVKMIIDEMGEDFVSDLESQVHYEGTYSVENTTLTLSGETSGGAGMDQGTINEDGTISVTSKMDDGTILDLTFTKQQ